LPNELHKPHLLVVENDPDDALLLGLAFKSLQARPTWFICRNPSEGQAYLRGAGMYSDRQKYALPSAIMTDLRLTGQSGADFAKWVRSQPEFQNIPIVIMSGCASPDEMKIADQAGANCVVRKPGRLEDLKTMLESLLVELFPD